MTFIHKALSGSQTVELFDRAARRAEGRIRRALLDALERVRDRETAAELQRLVEARKPNAILDLLDVGKGDDFIAFRAAISEAVSDGAKLAVRAQPPVEGPDGRKIEFVFDSQNPRLATYAQQISGTRIREIGNDVREVIRTIVAQDTVNGINPRDTARRIKDSIGLTARQEAAVMNYRRALETMDPAALERELRDKRSDGAVRRAIADQKRLSQKQIDGMVDRYRQKYLAYRSRTIARTEATRSLNGANHELFQSYIDEGKVAKEQVRRFWTPTLDERTRMGHLEIPQLPGNENGVGQDEPFQSRFGPIMYPGDPNARPDNTINCRCTVFSRIVSMELLRPRESRPPVQPQNTAYDVFLASRPDVERRHVAPAFRGTSDAALQTMSALPPLNDVVNLPMKNKKKHSGSFYKTLTRTVSMGSVRGTDPERDDYRRTFRHEYGHHIDAMIRQQQARSGRSFSQHDYFASADVMEDIAADGQELIATLSRIPARKGRLKSETKKMKQMQQEAQEQSQQLLTSIIDEADRIDRNSSSAVSQVVAREFERRGINPEQVAQMWPELKRGDNLSAVPAARFLVAWDRKDHAFLLSYDMLKTDAGAIATAGVSDSVQAAVGARFGHTFGHENKYWADSYRSDKHWAPEIAKVINGEKYSSANSTQAFANFFEVWSNPDEVGEYARQLYKHLLPRTYRAFESMVQGVTNG